MPRSADDPISAPRAPVSPVSNVVPIRRGPPFANKLPGPGIFDGGIPRLSERIAMLWRNSFDALALVDDCRGYRLINEPTTELLGAERDEILAARIDTFTPLDHLRALDGLWDELGRDGTLKGSYDALRGDGTRSLIEFRAIRDFVPGAHLIIAREIMPQFQSGPRPTAMEAVRLTTREREILQLAADGGTTHTIADVLVISPFTVKTHFEHIYKKLGVHHRVAAIAEGLRRGLID
jgi:DNA-binding CsgD family transcriptional regulator